MDASIIICTKRGRENRLKDCLESIKRMKTEYSYEILIVTKDDLDMDFLDSRSVRLMKSDPGLSNQRNVGSEKAEGEILTYIDDDLQVDEKWLDRLVRHFRKGADCVGGLILPKFEGDVPGWLKGREFFIGGSNYSVGIDRLEEGRNILGGNFSLRREVYKEKGGFNINLGRGSRYIQAGEETDYLERLKGAYCIVYAKDVVVKHSIIADKITKKYLLKHIKENGMVKGYIDFHYKGVLLNMISYVLKLPVVFIRLVTKPNVYVLSNVFYITGYFQIILREILRRH